MTENVAQVRGLDEAVAAVEEVDRLAYPGPGGGDDGKRARRLAIVVACVVFIATTQFLSSKYNADRVVEKLQTVQAAIASLQVSQDVTNARLQSLNMRFELAKRQGDMIHREIFRSIGHPELMTPIEPGYPRKGADDGDE